MNNIELFVNDTLIDFKTTTGLPFSVADIIDDLNEIGVMKSNKLLNFSDTIIIPATKINKHTAMLNCYFSSLIKRDQTSPTAIKAL